MTPLMTPPDDNQLILYEARLYLTVVIRTELIVAAFLFNGKPLRGIKNLDIKTDCHVTKFTLCCH